MLNTLALFWICCFLAQAFPLYDNLKTARAQQSAYNYVQGPGNATSDYVVVGGSTAGLTVAARLAEDPRVKVAVIEAGDLYEHVNGNLSIVPDYGASVSTPAVDWGFKPTWKELGLAQLKDLTTGSLIGNQYSPATTVQATKRARRAKATSLAEKIIFANNKATGVQVSSNSQNFTLYAKKEVILADGTLQTPQLLMVSGVGPQNILTQHGIEVILDLPGVGQNMEDHLFFSMVYEVDVVTLSKTLTDADFAAQVEAEYTKNHSGILTNTGADYFAWEKLPSEYLSKLSQQARTDLAAFPSDWPDYEVVIGDVPFAAGAEYAQAIGMLEAATARGNVSISSASMADPPLIDTQTLATSTDQQVAVQVINRMRELWSTKSYSAITDSADEILPGASVQTDEQILDYLLANAGSGFHCACTCE
ncbi:hypothetical protein KCU61_g4301, partial [Aureobasidium melanogenum]